MPPNTCRDSAASSQLQVNLKETYFLTPEAVPSPDATPDNIGYSTARSIIATSRLRRDSKHESTSDLTMRYDPAIAPMSGPFSEREPIRKRLSTLFSSAWQAVRRCISASPPSELDDLNSATAHLLHADRHQPTYGYGSIAAGAKPTIAFDDRSSGLGSTWSSPQGGRNSRGAQPTPKRNFVV